MASPQVRGLWPARASLYFSTLLASSPMASGAPDGTRTGAAGRAGRRWRQAVGFGLIAGTLTGFALIGLIAAPLFLWAKATEPELGLQRPFVRDWLRAAPFLGLAAFALTAVLSARWRLREGRDEGPGPEPE